MCEDDSWPVGCQTMTDRVHEVGAVLALEELSAGLVTVDLDDLDVGGLDGDGGGLAVLLVDDALVNVDHPALAVNLLHLTLAVLVLANLDADLVLLADGEGAHVVLGAELLREGRRHEDAADAGGGREVSLAGLSPGGGGERLAGDSAGSGGGRLILEKLAHYNYQPRKTLTPTRIRYPALKRSAGLCFVVSELRSIICEK